MKTIEASEDFSAWIEYLIENEKKKRIVRYELIELFLLMKFVDSVIVELFIHSLNVSSARKNDSIFKYRIIVLFDLFMQRNVIDL